MRVPGGRIANACESFRNAQVSRYHSGVEPIPFDVVCVGGGQKMNSRLSVVGAFIRLAGNGELGGAWLPVCHVNCCTPQNRGQLMNCNVRARSAATLFLIKNLRG